MAILIIRDSERYGYSSGAEIYGVLEFPNPTIREKAIAVIEDVMNLNGWTTEDMWDALSEFPYECKAFDDFEEIYI